MPNYTYSGYQRQNVDTSWGPARIVDQHSRWNRILTPLCRLFRLNYFWLLDEGSDRRRLWVGRVR